MRPLARDWIRAVTLGLAVTLFLVNSIGCRRSRRAQWPPITFDTPAASSVGSCDFDLSDNHEETVFLVLGALDEYLGRFIVEDDDTVERFYCDERKVADWFNDELRALIEEQGLPTHIRRQTTQDCLISYRSRLAADKLNSCYRYTLGNSPIVEGADGRYKRTARPSLGVTLFLRSGSNGHTGSGLSAAVFRRNRALAYVAGAWARHRRRGSFVFANSRDKAQLVGQLLTYLGCMHVKLESSVGLIPQSNIVRFEPNEEVARRLRALDEIVKP